MRIVRGLFKGEGVFCSARARWPVWEQFKGGKNSRKYSNTVVMKHKLSHWGLDVHVFFLWRGLVFPYMVVSYSVINDVRSLTSTAVSTVCTILSLPLYYMYVHIHYFLLQYNKLRLWYIPVCIHTRIQCANFHCKIITSYLEAGLGSELSHMTSWTSWTLCLVQTILQWLSFLNSKNCLFILHS